MLSIDKSLFQSAASLPAAMMQLAQEARAHQLDSWVVNESSIISKEIIPGVNQRKKMYLYCSHLGIGLDGYPRKYCCIDPASAYYKHEVRQKCLQMCINKGFKIPEDILADKNSEPAVKAVAKSVSAVTQAMLSEQEVRGLVGNLIENGKLGYQEAELIVELVVEQGDTLARLPLHASLMPAGDVVNQVIGLNKLVASAPKLA